MPNEFSKLKFKKIRFFIRKEKPHCPQVLRKAGPQGAFWKLGDQGPRLQKVQVSQCHGLGGFLAYFAGSHCPTRTAQAAKRTLNPVVDAPALRAEVATVEPATPVAAVAEADVVPAT